MIKYDNQYQDRRDKMLFVMAQICGVLGMILTIVGVQLKTKEKIVLCSVVANIVVAIQFFLLSAYTGFMVSIINAIRCVIFYYYKKKDIQPSIVILIIFEVLCIISGIFSWKSIEDIIPIIVTLIYTYGLWQDNVKVIKITTGIAGFGWAIYNTIVMAYVGALQEILQLVSAIIAIVRERNSKNKIVEKV